MKLWRKLAKKEPNGKRNGRDIRYQLFIGEQMAKTSKKSYDLLDALIQRAGIKFVMTKKEEAKLKEMIESVSKKEEVTDETK